MRGEGGGLGCDGCRKGEGEEGSGKVWVRMGGVSEGDGKRGVAWEGVRERCKIGKGVGKKSVG